MTRGLSLSLARARRRRGAAPFHPTQIAAVAAGYFWDPAQATGSGTAGFALPEGNGKTSYDLITPAANTAPAITTVNGHPVIAYANATPDKCARVSGNVQRGFTGAAMLWGWVSSAASNIGGIIGHGRTIQFALQLNTADVRVYVHDGAGIKESRFPLPSGGYAAGPVYCEAVFDPSAGATSRIQLTFDRVAQVPTVAGSPGTTMQDSAEVMGFSYLAGDSSNFNISGDYSIGAAGITSGIPSDADRDRLFNYRRLK